MLFPPFNGRRFVALLAGMLCALGLAESCPVAEASILLPGDTAVAHELGCASERIDLSVSCMGAASRPSAAANAENGQASADGVHINWQGIFSSESSSGLTGTSAPTNSLSVGPQAVLHAVNASAADLLVMGWLHDASHFGLPEGMPRSLLRPPQG